MIISPPFLPERAAGTSEDAWLDSAMVAPASRLADTQAPEGSFPLSYNLAWHNGMHLQAPQASGSYLPVRAVADGTVVFASKPKARNAEAGDAQNYNPFVRSGTEAPAWTDNGCVVIEHRTTIGANGAAETEVAFYSVYMHLSELGRITPAGQTSKRFLQAGDAIWRKDEVGKPGKVYGHDGQIHFEICMDADNLHKLIGRAPNWVEPAGAPATPAAPTADGREDTLFGSMYFYLPANTPTASGATRPASNLRRPEAQAGSTLGTPVWVKMTYDCGTCQFTTLDERGRQIAELAAMADVEYDLFKEATDRHAALPPAEQTHSSPSGWYELLRFGRNIGRGPNATDKDPLPANAAHWRRIAGPDGHAVWADLNAQGSFKFSDADFLPVLGWNCIDDDTSPSDQRCDSDHIKTLIRDPDAGNANRMEPAELTRRLGVVAVRATLRKTICKFPSEWDQATISERYGFVKELEPFNTEPALWAKLEAHLKALSFEGLPATLLAADWRGHPREIIGQLRRCLWLSASQFKQLMPLEVLRKTAHGAVWERVARRAVDGSIATSQRVPLNIMMRKHQISASAQRMASFFGNALQETQWLDKLHEGNSAERYAPWDGRGFLQLTWPSNYLDYWSYRGRGAEIPAATRTALLQAEQEANRARTNAGLMRLEPELRRLGIADWRDAIADFRAETLDPAESAGYYWSKLRMASYADEPHQLERVASGSSGNPSRPYYRSPAFWRASACVNLPGAIGRLYIASLNGFEARCVPYSQTLAVLGEVRFSGGAGGSAELFPEGLLPRRGA